MSEAQLLENIKNGCSTVKKPKNVKEIHKIKKAPIKYEMPEQKTRASQHQPLETKLLPLHTES